MGGGGKSGCGRICAQFAALFRGLRPVVKTNPRCPPTTPPEPRPRKLMDGEMVVRDYATSAIRRYSESRSVVRLPAYTTSCCNISFCEAVSISPLQIFSPSNWPRIHFVATRRTVPRLPGVRQILRKSIFPYAEPLLLAYPRFNCPGGEIRQLPLGVSALCKYRVRRPGFRFPPSPEDIVVCIICGI